MPRGSKSRYTNKQKRKAEHIEEGYEKRGTNKKEAERRAWATVNKMDKGGKKKGPGRGKKTNKAPARKGGKKSGAKSTGKKKNSRALFSNIPKIPAQRAIQPPPTTKSS